MLRYFTFFFSTAVVIVFLVSDYFFFGSSPLRALKKTRYKIYFREH